MGLNWYTSCVLSGLAHKSLSLSFLFHVFNFHGILHAYNNLDLSIKKYFIGADFGGSIIVCINNCCFVLLTKKNAVLWNEVYIKIWCAVNSCVNVGFNSID